MYRPRKFATKIIITRKTVNHTGKELNNKGVTASNLITINYFVDKAIRKVKTATWYYQPKVNEKLRLNPFAMCVCFSL